MTDTRERDPESFNKDCEGEKCVKGTVKSEGETMRGQQERREQLVEPCQCRLGVGLLSLPSEF